MSEVVKLVPATKTMLASEFHMGVSTLEINPDSVGQRTETNPGWTKSQGIIASMLDPVAYLGELILRIRKTNKEVIDGGHRTRAIYNFFTGKFALAKGTKYTTYENGKKTEIDVSGKKFGDLPDHVKAFLMNYELIVVEFPIETTDKQAGHIFQIKNIATPINNQERLNSESDNLVAIMVRETARQIPNHKPKYPMHELFREYIDRNGNKKAVNLKDVNKRLSYDQFVAYLLCSAIEGRMAISGHPDLDVIWEKYGDSEYGLFVDDPELEREVYARLKGCLDFLLVCADTIKDRMGYGPTNDKLVMLSRLYWYLYEIHNGKVEFANSASDKYRFVDSFHKAWYAICGKKVGSPADARWERLLQGSDRKLTKDLVSYSHAFTSFLKDFSNLAKINATISWMLEEMGEEPEGIAFRGRRGFSSIERESQLVMQQHKCFIDGKPLKLSDADAAHIVAFADGGETKMENMVMVRREYNRKMGTLNALEFKKMFEEGRV